MNFDLGLQKAKVEGNGKCLLTLSQQHRVHMTILFRNFLILLYKRDSWQIAFCMKGTLAVCRLVVQLMKIWWDWFKSLSQQHFWPCFPGNRKEFGNILLNCSKSLNHMAIKKEIENCARTFVTSSRSFKLTRNRVLSHPLNVRREFSNLREYNRTKPRIVHQIAVEFQYTVKSEIKAAACIFFFAIFSAAYKRERLILSRF